jgi:hypothetical protein
MPNSISKLAFYLVRYNLIIFEIFLAKSALQFVIVGIMYLIGIVMGDKEASYILTLGIVLTIIASFASIIIGIMGYIKGPRMWIEKIKRIQGGKAVFIIIIMVLIAPPLSLFTLFLLIFINA